MTLSRCWLAGAVVLALALNTTHADSPPVKKAAAQKKSDCCQDKPSVQATAPKSVSADCPECCAAKKAAASKGSCEQKDAACQASVNGLLGLTFPDFCFEFCLGGLEGQACPDLAYTLSTSCAECAECCESQGKNILMQATRAPTTAEVGIQKALERIADQLEAILRLAKADAAQVAVPTVCEATMAGVTFPSPTCLPYPPQYFTPAPTVPMTRELVTSDRFVAAQPIPSARAVPPPPSTVLANPVPLSYSFDFPTSPAQTCSVTVPVAAISARRTDAVWGVRVVTEAGKACLAMTAKGAPEVRFEQFVLKLTDGQSVRVWADGKKIMVSTPELAASADLVGTSAAGDDLVLSGHVEMAYQKGSHKARVAGERITITLKNDVLVCEVK